MLRVPFAYDVDAVSAENAVGCVGESRTSQEFKEECDINTIINRFGIGDPAIVAQNWTTNVDITEATSDFQSAMNALVEAADQFNSLPARVRSRFDNDPAMFVDFVSDPSNVEEMIALGLATRREPVAAPSIPPPGGDGTVTP